jgi:putative membrane protein
MMSLIFRWIINALALLGVAMLVPGFEVASFGYALLAAFVLGLVNAVVRPLLFILTLPVTIITLGLFTFVLNALMLWLVSSVLDGFMIVGFVPALMGAILLWGVSVFTNFVIKHAKES